MKIKQQASRYRSKLAYAGIGVVLRTTDLSIRWLGYRQSVLLLQTLSPQPALKNDQLHRAQAIARQVNLIARHPKINVTCLRRSLVLWWLLRWRGIFSEVKIGVNITGGHAWVTYDGQIINDMPEFVEQYRVIELDKPSLKRVTQHL